MKKRLFPLLFGVILIIFPVIFPPLALAQTSPTQITIPVSGEIPGANATSSGPGGFIANFYSFALLISGILAFGAIVYGGVRYAAGRGNPSAESEGRSWITGALLGLLLLAGAYIILRTVNPDIVGLQVNGVTPFANLPAGASSQQGCAGGSCTNLASTGLTCKPASQQPGGVNSCSAAPGMASTLQCMQAHGAPPFTVTEAMPPTVDHLSQCHNDGCCVDTVVNSGNCADVQALVSAAQACGGAAANEYANCNGTTYSTTEGNNVHINSASGGGC